MKISTKGRYGLRAILYLAIHAEGSHVPLHQIAENQQLSVGYTEQIFSTLRRAGIVKSVKGAQGGYVLADLPEQITVGAVFRALEGDLALTQEESQEENPFERCINRAVWQPLDERISELLDTVTLATLMADYQKHDTGGYVFMI